MAEHSASADGLPLSGITVVSIEQAVAAPFATRQLADLGARVIKVERPGGGDFARRYDTTVHGQSSYFVWLNRSKESLTLDLKSDAAARSWRNSSREADVFVQNLGPGRRRPAWAWTPTHWPSGSPSLIPCSISGYGTSGPWADRKAYDLLVQCQTGLVSLTGTAEETARVGVSVADIAAGHVRLQRHPHRPVHAGDHAARARAVEVSLFEALAEWMGQPAYYTRARRHPAAAGRHPARHHRPVRDLHRRRRQGRAALRPERARVGAPCASSSSSRPAWSTTRASPPAPTGCAHREELERDPRRAVRRVRTAAR